MFLCGRNILKPHRNIEYDGKGNNDKNLRIRGQKISSFRKLPGNAIGSCLVHII